MKLNLAKYTLLVVDDFSQFRLTLKSMLERKGAVRVDQAANSIDALKSCAENRYDIIFCDYNLGEGQDGQQLLEELHERSLLPRDSLFMMVTAEMVSAQVIGALEYRPDAYLAKPFQFEQLSVRLDRLIARREALGDIYRALDAGMVEDALALCDDVIRQKPALRLSCLRIKSEILEQQQEFDAAGKIYREVLDEQPLQWATLGIGKLIYNGGKYQQALDHFRQMQQDFPRQVAVVDWIARCLEQLSEIEASEEALKQAIEISPKSVNRQAKLGEIAESLGHHEVAKKAFARTISEGRHSCLLNAEHFRRYFDNTARTMAETGVRERSRIVAEIERTGKQVESRYRGDPASLALNQCALANLFAAADRQEQSSRYLDRMSVTLQNPECRLSEEGCAYIERVLGDLETGKGSENTVQEIVASLESHRKHLDSVRKQDGEARAINQLGLTLLRKNRAREALQRFREAVDTMPDNPTYLINAAQTVLFDDEMRDERKLMRDAREWLERIDLKQDDERRPLYLMLRARLPHA